MRPRLLLLAFVLSLGACRGAPKPAVSFLAVTEDSTYWVHEESRSLNVRSSPMLLGNINGRWQELYVADDDRSFFDAVIIGQRLYRRDLVTGDSTLVREDSAIARFAGQYAAAHPSETPLAPDEEGADEPTVQFATETDLLGVFGPYANIEFHQDVVGVRDLPHVTTRGVINLVSGARVSIEELAGAEEAKRVFSVASEQLKQAKDSVRRSVGEAARRARAAIDAFEFDSLSFTILRDDTVPTVAFLVPGYGEHAGGLALPLPPIRLTGGGWWRDVVRSLPRRIPGGEQLWPDSTYEVRGRWNATSEQTTIRVIHPRRQYEAFHIDGTLEQLHRLPVGEGVQTMERALARAFDESLLYARDTRAIVTRAPTKRSNKSLGYHRHVYRIPWNPNRPAIHSPL